MKDLPRRTLADLAARYDLEPELHDIIVEGQFDREIIERSLREANVPSRIVYAIDTIDVPNELVEQHGLTTGNKQRVIVLARELACLPDICEFRCLVDRDLDHWFQTMEQVKRLRWTAYCALELHFFTDELIHDILVTTAKCRIPKWIEYRDSMISVLQTLYILRLADRELEFNLKWVSTDKCLSLTTGLVTLDEEEYIKRLLLSNRRGRQRDEFQASVKRWRTIVTGDYRCSIHGHDFVQLLAWSISKSKGMKEFAGEDAVTRLLVLLASRAEGIVETLS